MEKRQRAFDKTVHEWESKVAGLNADLDVSQAESRNFSAELFRVRAQFEESNDVIASVRRENKNLSGT